MLLRCRQWTTVDERRSTSIVWYRRSGDVRHQLAVHDALSAEFGTTTAGGSGGRRPRLSVTHQLLDDDALESNLTISGTS